ncbi:hypothetical protein Y032_0016g3013 [Ancylostoma ceylanicum]|uniref:SSD domain-containing protein n=1 Tax=Ancylostoma ceylanicum TaxID=53326 RepID=A0A016V626_9BILA|nr:hypothetical protein Y032_0016g3013 [Ancylostoma ceylanicum]
MSLFGVTLDPIVMSIAIMCIGFSVDIPAHVSFHYHTSRSKIATKGTSSNLSSASDDDGTQFRSRLQHTLCSVGFPVIQAGVSTNLCALPLAFVPLYMAQVFSLGMLMCISISMTHGILVLPAMFCLYDRISNLSQRCISYIRKQKRCFPA